MPDTSSRPDEVCGSSSFSVWLDRVPVPVAQVLGLSLPLEDPRPRGADPGRVVLRRAVAADRTFFDWALAARRGAHEVRIDLGGAESPVLTWVLGGARALRWIGPELDAMSPAVAMEGLEIGYERVDWRDSRRA